MHLRRHHEWLGVILTAGLGMIITSWTLDIMKLYETFRGLIMSYVIYIYRYINIRRIRS